MKKRARTFPSPVAYIITDKPIYALRTGVSPMETGEPGRHIMERNVFIGPGSKRE
jgi:hypothetical protein